MELGIPQKVLESAVGFSKEELANDDLKIPVENTIKMLKKSIALKGPDIAIKLGAKATPEIMGVLGQIMKNCTNLREAADQFIRFQNLYLAVSKFKIRIEGSSSILSHSVTAPVSDYDNQLINEVNLSICVAAARKLIGAEFVPKEVRFSHKKPEYVEVYKQHFRSPLKFNQKENAIVMDRNIGQKTIPDSYPYMKNILLKYAEDLLTRLEAGKQFQDDVKRIISDLLPKGIVDIERVSERLNMSRWTLNRRLKKEGTTFKDLLTELRREFAINYLENGILSITEIAFLLGYSEDSAFHRAFKSWTGATPNEYRRSQL
jgi:AraC-like DNA-binding protein